MPTKILLLKPSYFTAITTVDKAAADQISKRYPNLFDTTPRCAATRANGAPVSLRNTCPWYEYNNI